MKFHYLIAAAALAALPVSSALADQHGGGMPGAQFMTAWDLDADGQATLEELVEMRGTVFAMFDLDESGILDEEELGWFAEARAADMENHQGGQQGRQRLQQVGDGLGAEANDTDGDGQVSLAEFIDGTPGWLAAIDRDGDGVVTTADFGR